LPQALEAFNWPHGSARLGFAEAELLTVEYEIELMLVVELTNGVAVANICLVAEDVVFG
jgi:hypothetical protein